jgi:hypothetical protein
MDINSPLSSFRSLVEGNNNNSSNNNYNNNNINNASMGAREFFIILHQLATLYRLGVSVGSPNGYQNNWHIQVRCIISLSYIRSWLRRGRKFNFGKRICCVFFRVYMQWNTHAKSEENDMWRKESLTWASCSCHIEALEIREVWN